jgi:hypothetical protein
MVLVETNGLDHLHERGVEPALVQFAQQLVQPCP